MWLCYVSVFVYLQIVCVCVCCVDVVVLVERLSRPYGNNFNFDTRELLLNLITSLKFYLPRCTSMKAENM